MVWGGWWMGVLNNELTAVYGAYSQGEPDPLPALEIQYVDYAVWQRQWLAGERLQRQARYWQAALAGGPALLELPTAHGRPVGQSYVGASVAVVLCAAVTGGFARLGGRYGMPLFMSLL